MADVRARAVGATLGKAEIMIKRQAAFFFIFDSMGRILFLRRTATDPSWPLLWDVPGGRLEPGETALEGAVRETREETTIRLDPNKAFYLGVYSRPKSDGVFFGIRLDHTPFVSFPDQEHDDLIWAYPHDVKVKLVPSVKAMLKAWLERNEHA